MAHPGPNEQRWKHNRRSHQRPRHGHDGQIVGQAFQGRITTRPVDTIEKDVALTARRDELVLADFQQSTITSAAI